MPRQINVRIAIFLFVFINIIFAQDSDTSGVTFPIRYNWLQQKYPPIDIYQSKGLTLAPDNYAALNHHLLSVNYQGQESKTYVDSTGENIYFRTTLDNSDIYWPLAMNLDEYYRRKAHQNLRENLRLLAIENTQKQETKSGGQKLELIGAEIAGQRVALRVSGNINISGQMNNRQRETVATNIQEGKTTDFKIDQQMRFNIEGTIGDRISILVDQDSERSFDFENNMRILYTGKEDEIVQGVQAGNISLSLPGTRFVTFSSKNSGLFGLKADMKFGPVNLTTIASVEKGEKQKLSYEGGSQKTELEIEDFNYVRNKYFFLDNDFKDRFWPLYWQNDSRFTFTEEVVRELEVYKSVPLEDANTLDGIAYVDPNFPNEHPDETESTYFVKLEEGLDYEYSADLGYLMMKRTYTNQVIGVAYVVRNSNTDEIIREYGDWDRDWSDTTNSEIVLKLIQPRSLPSNSHPCWDLMWRNVYNLGTTNIDSTGFDLKIMFDGATGPEERDQNDGETFIKKFGLDERDASGRPGKDDMPDLGRGLVRLSEGELWLPYLHPFSYDESESKIGNPNINEDYSCDIMYENSIRTRKSEIVEDSKFKIVVKYENRSSVIQLGPMVMEGSEEIILNGTKLVKGTDYDIDYMMGTLTLYDPMATSANAKLDVKFEKNSFFQLKKKTILGARAQYDFGPDKKNFLGATALYYSKSTVDDKVEVGYEPMANFVFDINGRIQQDLNFLTKTIDRLPLISTDKQSVLTVEGEIARVLPNPNTSNNKPTGDYDGVAYIDDFEGSKRTVSPVMTKNFWSKSGPPVEKDEYYDEEIKQNMMAGHTFWFVDYDGIDINNIWPDKDVGSGASSQDRRVNPLYLYLEPDAAPATGEDAPTELKKEAWGGITYYFPSSSWDQSKTKFVDLWIRSEGKGTLHIDLGTISEDQIPDKKLNTEDVAGNFANNIYDDGEDIGLDGSPDEEEFLIVKSWETGNYETLYYGDEKLKKYKRDPKDPSLDNFKYKAGTQNFEYLRTVNGTENNAKDAGTNGRPDTENRNNNPAIDIQNNYRSVAIPLKYTIDDPENQYIESETEKSGMKTGWKLYRIPLIEFQNMNGFDDASFGWENIESMRLWLDGVEDNDERVFVAIAKIEMVRNEWEAQGIAQGTERNEIITSDSSFIADDKTFGTTVKNTEENEDYEPPDGVEGERDKVNQVQRKEQSLVLKIYNDEGSFGLRPMEIASAEKDLLEELSMINYKRLKMFVNGYKLNDGREYLEGEKTPLVYFLRFGKGGNAAQYFEIRKPVYAGWDKKNHLDIDIDFMTSLKKYVHEDDYVPKNPDGIKEFWITEDEEYTEIRVYKEVKDGDYTGKEIIIYGTPSISRIKRMETGIINTGSQTIYGEVWLNELRLSEVRKNAGTAARASLAMNFADVADFNVNLERQDADFHRVEQQPSSQAGSLSDKKSYSASANLYLHKFFPSKWGLSLPVRTTMNYNESRPKYLPGTDILAGENPADSISSISQSYGINTSFSKRASDFWLAKYTIDQVRIRFSTLHTQSSSKQITNNEGEKYTAGFNYGIPFGRNNFLEPLKWTEEIPVMKNFAEMKLYYTPEKFSYSLNAMENINKNIPRKGDTTSTHIMSMSQTVDFGYKLTDNIKIGYNRSMNNNLDEIAEDKWNNFKQFKFGTNEDVQEKYTLSFSPRIFSWFSPQLTYASNYNWSEPLTSNTAYLDNLSNNASTTISASIKIADVFKSIYSSDAKSSSSKSSRSSSSRRGSPRRSRSESGETDKKEAEAPKDHPILDGIHKYLDKINTISATYSLTNSVRNNFREVKHAGFDYRIGLSQDPGLDTLNAGTNLNSPTENRTLTLRSGLDLVKGVRTTFNYSYNNSFTISQGVEKETIAEDYFPGGEKGDEGFPFPNWQVSISGLEKLPLMDKIFQSLSARHGFTGKKQISLKDGEEINSSYRIGFTPILSLSMKFKKNINSNFSANMTNMINNQEAGMEKSSQMGLSFDVSYKHKGGITIPIPFMEKKKLDNNIDFTMAVEYSASDTYAKQAGNEKFSKTDERSTLSIKPRIGYSFTQKVTGGVFFQYQVINDVQLGERKNMNYGFDVNIAIRG